MSVRVKPWDRFERVDVEGHLKEFAGVWTVATGEFPPHVDLVRYADGRVWRDYSPFCLSNPGLWRRLPEKTPEPRSSDPWAEHLRQEERIRASMTGQGISAAASRAADRTEAEAWRRERGPVEPMRSGLGGGFVSMWRLR